MRVSLRARNLLLPLHPWVPALCLIHHPNPAELGNQMWKWLWQTVPKVTPNLVFKFITMKSRIIKITEQHIYYKGGHRKRKCYWHDRVEFLILTRYYFVLDSAKCIKVLPHWLINKIPMEKHDYFNFEDESAEVYIGCTFHPTPYS